MKSVQRAYYHPLLLSKEQEALMSQCKGTQRLIYNLCLDSYLLGGRRTSGVRHRKPSYEDLTNELTKFRNDPDYEWLKPVPYEVQKQAIRDFIRACKRFYDGLAGFPKHKKRSNKESFRFTVGFKTHNPEKPGAIRLPNLGWIKVQNAYPSLKKKGLQYEGKLQSITITCKNGKYYASLQCEVSHKKPSKKARDQRSRNNPWIKDNKQTREVARTGEIVKLIKKQAQAAKKRAQAQKASSKPSPTSPKGSTKPKRTYNDAIGLDLGITNSVTLSNGEIYHFPLMTEGEKQSILKLERKREGQVKGSKNRARTQQRINKKRERVQNRLINAQHQLSRYLVDNYSFIGVEALKIKNMSASAAGTIEEPGKNVAAKRGLNLSIQSQAWARFLSMLEYKSEWFDHDFVKINPAYTSKACAVCGKRYPGSRDGEAYDCQNPDCKASSHADVNASLNILTRAIIKHENQCDPEERLSFLSPSSKTRMLAKHLIKTNISTGGWSVQGCKDTHPHQQVPKQ